MRYTCRDADLFPKMSGFLQTVLPMIVFSHANSYGAATYRRLFDGWHAAGQEVVAVERYGHDAAFPVDHSWRGMAQQLIDLIDRQTEPKVFLVGHSMGGYLSLMAAGQRPQRIAGVILLDSPVVYGWKAGLVSMLKATGQMRRFPPAAVAAKRRDRWPSLDEVHRHFVAKKLFARWHPDVLHDYVRFGTEGDPAAAGEGRRLHFHREVESHIYSTVPHWLESYLHRHPPGGPVAFIGGKRSREVRQVGLAATRRISEGRMSWLDGSHLFPFERPDDTVREVLSWIARLQAQAALRAA